MKKSNLTLTAPALLAGALALLQAGCANSPGRSTPTAAKPYPLDYCLVSGDKIGGMGQPVVIVYRGREIKFCCPDCPPQFNKDPEKYLKKLAAEEEKAGK
jgi:YHS domain-containing protein